MGPTIYVAGSSREIPRVREAMRALVRAGCSIAGDWVEQVERYGSAGADLDDDQRAECAVNDLGAIDRADGVLVLWPRTPSVGAYVELGYAIALHDLSGDRSRPVVIAGGVERIPDGDAAYYERVESIWHAYVASHEGCEVCALDDEGVATLVSLLRGGGAGAEGMSAVCGRASRCAPPLGRVALGSPADAAALAVIRGLLADDRIRRSLEHDAREWSAACDGHEYRAAQHAEGSADRAAQDERGREARQHRDLYRAVLALHVPSDGDRP